MTKVSTIDNRTDIITVKVYDCTVQISNIIKGCVNVLRVLECKLEDVDATA